MKQSTPIFAIIGAYFFIVTAIYVIWNLISTGYIEWVGTLASFGAGAMGFLIAYYSHLTVKKNGGPFIEDLHEVDIDDGNPEVGEFAPWSWWPITLALAASLFVMGFALGFNFWITFFAVPFLLVSVVGWVYEYYRGYHAR